MADFAIHNEGSVFLFVPLTEAAIEFTEETIQPEPWQYFGPAFAVDHRYAYDLAERLQDDGFEID